MLTLLILAAATEVQASPLECSDAVSRLVGGTHADRVVITFTGTQKALLSLDEGAGPGIESTLFPVARDRFVLTLQLRPDETIRSKAAVVAREVCSAGASSGARFNGVMSFKREYTTVQGRTLTRDRMIDAAMADIPK
jgi:hypothetical protein